MKDSLKGTRKSNAGRKHIPEIFRFNSTIEKPIYDRIKNHFGSIPKGFRFLDKLILKEEKKLPKKVEKPEQPKDWREMVPDTIKSRWKDLDINTKKEIRTMAEWLANPPKPETDEPTK